MSLLVAAVGTAAVSEWHLAAIAEATGCDDIVFGLPATLICLIRALHAFGQ